MKKSIYLILFFFCISYQNGISQENEDYKSTLKKMLQVSGSEETFKSIISQMLGMFRQQHTQVPENVWEELEEDFLKISLDDLVTHLSPVYEKHLTQNDIQEIIKFYSTPIGKKYAEKTPLITQESMQAGQEWGMKIGMNLQQKLKEKGY